MTSHRIHGELCLFMCVLAIFAGETTAVAQVRIKERVEIFPAPMTPDNRTLAEPAGAEMIASTGGVLKVKVNYLTSLNSPIPSDAHISIHVHDTTYTIPVSEYAGETAENAGAASDYCNLIFWLPVTEYVRSFREGMDSLYQLSGIEAGDTMVFTYDGGVVAGGVMEMDTDSTWDVYLSLRDDCLHSIAFPHGAFDRVWCWLTLEVEPEEHTIMLGETKYYQAREDPSNSDRLILQESAEPTANMEWILDSDIWGTEPFERILGQSLGVYWDMNKERFTLDAHGLGSVTTESLDPGVIRAVGRYYAKDEPSVVRLKARRGGRSGSIEITVISPDSLGGRPYRTARDVFNNEIVLDTLVVSHAGLSGIPPQLIKGQMDKETNATPAYRYEPWEDIKYQTNARWRRRYFGSPNCFVVDSARGTMGTGNSIPTTHSNVRTTRSPIAIDYTRSPLTIRQYLAAWLKEYARSRDTTIFNAGGVAIQKKWRENCRMIGKRIKSRREVLSIALDSTAEQLERGAVGEKKYDRTAQTRIMASYGFVQLTHYTATDKNLNGFGRRVTDHNPELLNEQQYCMPAYTQRLNRELPKVIGTSMPEGNWRRGYFGSWLVVLGCYNPYENGYPNAVMDRSTKYYPKRKAR
jgi:hypothetical protein